MPKLRLVLICCAAVAAATLVSGAALATSTMRSAPPKDLRGFLLRPSEPLSHAFSRTPSFAWKPVRGALCYEFELGTSKSFAESTIVWSNVRTGVKPGTGCAAVPVNMPAPTTGSGGASGSTSGGSGSTTGTGGTPAPTTATTDPALATSIRILRVPAVSVDMALPWFTGQPYALYTHVRAITRSGPTGWSKPYAFNMRWPGVATPLSSQPGFVRWTPVSGATSYQVWFPQISKVIATHTNVADEREFYTWHSDKAWWATARWRVRAVRQVFGEIPNGLPAVSYGPWSPVYTASNPDLTAGKLTLQVAVSDRSSTPAKPASLELMPALTWTGNQGLDGKPYRLFRTYASTDIDCVNLVYRGAVTGSPAYAPRTTGPLKLPFSDAEITTAAGGWIADGTSEGATLGADGFPVATSEGSAPTTGGAGSSGSSGSGSGGSASSGASASNVASIAKVDLPDIDFPSTRYYWTVVPVELRTLADNSRKYIDVDLPQDACASGRVASFGKASEPVRVSSTTPYVSGLAPNGRLLASAGKQPVVFSTPLINWEPATGASSYEVQWSRTKYPWRAQGTTSTYSTSAVLDLAPGTWYYRVRGLNQAQFKKPQMAWSTPVKLKVAKPQFRVAAAKKK
ncbi:hypothetical protein [Gaiella sp.]|uniref:hypothetical protein n=1 Tax=Gaiella sp. TaxID=2663207 RepID=UPI0032641263